MLTNLVFEVALKFFSFVTSVGCNVMKYREMVESVKSRLPIASPESPASRTRDRVDSSSFDFEYEYGEQPLGGDSRYEDAGDGEVTDYSYIANGLAGVSAEDRKLSFFPLTVCACVSVCKFV